MKTTMRRTRGFRAAAVVAVGAALLAFTGSSRAANVSGSFSETGIGARSLGLGGAFVAVADDAYAMTANPSGLALLQSISGTFDYANLYGLGLLKQSYFGLAVPTRWGVHGFSYQGMQVEFSPFPQKLTETTLGYSYARLFGPLALGATVKYLDLSSDFSQGTGSGLGIDIGLRYQHSPRLSLGAAIRNAYASVQYGTGTTETIPSSWRAGAAYRLSDRWLVTGEWGGVSGDYFSRFRAGTEYWIMRPGYLSRTLGATTVRNQSIFRQVERQEYPLALALRCGLEKQFTGDEKAIPAVGTTLGFGSVRLDYAYIFASKGPGETNRFSLTYDFTPWKVEPEERGDEAGRGEERNPEAQTPVIAAPAAAPTAARRAVAVLDFANATGHAELGWLSLGLADIVAKELQAAGLPVIARANLAGTASLTGPEILTLSQQSGARLVVRGLFVKNSAGRMVLTARVIDGATGRTLDFIEAEAPETEIFVLGKSIGQGVAQKAGAWLAR